MADRTSIDLDELVEHWTVLDDGRALIDAKYGARRLGFALLLKHYTRHGRFPTEPADLPAAVVEFIAGQLGLEAADLGSYEWAGRSIERHRAQIREQLGFRECTVADAEQLTAWLAEHVAQRERRHDRLRDELLARCRSERVEPPAPARIDRIVRSALRVSEERALHVAAHRVIAAVKAVVAHQVLMHPCRQQPRLRRQPLVDRGGAGAPRPVRGAEGRWPRIGWPRSRERVGELAGGPQGGEDRRDAGGFAVLDVGVDDALQLGLAFDVAFDQVDAIGVVDGHVHDGDVPRDPLRLDCALPCGDAVALELDDAAGGRHDRGASSGVCAQRALLP
ncbi:MAG: DUF4158 domain-containing protein [Actinobacteria bacterium]|nr:DUF4158 domain-containing protein [Actinomycetota bacterium]